MRLHEELADWWPLVSSPADYTEEADEHIRLLRAAASGPLREVLELGSGGGNNSRSEPSSVASWRRAHCSARFTSPRSSGLGYYGALLHCAIAVPRHRRIVGLKPGLAYKGPRQAPPRSAKTTGRSP